MVKYYGVHYYQEAHAIIHFHCSLFKKNAGSQNSAVEKTGYRQIPFNIRGCKSKAAGKVGLVYYFFRCVRTRQNAFIKEYTQTAG